MPPAVTNEINTQHQQNTWTRKTKKWRAHSTQALHNGCNSWIYIFDTNAVVSHNYAGNNCQLLSNKTILTQIYNSTAQRRYDIYTETACEELNWRFPITNWELLFGWSSPSPPCVIFACTYTHNEPATWSTYISAISAQISKYFSNAFNNSSFSVIQFIVLLSVHAVDTEPGGEYFSIQHIEQVWQCCGFYLGYVVLLRTHLIVMCVCVRVNDIHQRIQHVSIHMKDPVIITIIVHHL